MGTTVVATVVGLATAAAALVALPAPQAGATVTSFTPGDVVYRVGTGTGSLASSGTAVFLDEYSPTGNLVQSVPLPTAASGSNKPLVASGTASSEGELTLSGDGRYLMAAGYDTSLGTTGLSSSAAATIPRTVGRVDGDDGVAATPDGGGYWEVAAGGGVFSFGDANFFGSMGGTPLNQPVVGVAS
jgi:hypothetical protein